ncbi:MAG: Gfo/Idh/MocA family oxidoreductase [Candidatus Marinimicrobia bacterium]|nr:Gfo/Idh/MocA family oxidoreductase [Candidatus Neomarinimicrobiota bacterium]
MSSIRVAQFGCGYWGPHLMRNLFAHPAVEVAGLVDTNDKVRDWLAGHYPELPFSTNTAMKQLEEWGAQAVVLATPAGTHFDLASQVLESGRHCLVEKPLAMTSGECRQLIDLATRAGVILMVGHTFLFNPVVRELKTIIQAGNLGEIYYAHAQRLNLGRVRKDIDAVWNLAPHDISILLYLFGQMPSRVSARGASYIQPGIADVAFLDLEFPDGKYASIQVSWLDPQKVRRLTVVGSQQMAVYDDVAENKLVIYDKGVDRAHPEKATLGSYEDFGTFQLRLRAGGIQIPQIDFVEPLKMEIAEFVEAILQNRKPLTDGANGLHTVQVLEAATRSMALEGTFVSVER